MRKLPFLIGTMVVLAAPGLAADDPIAVRQALMSSNGASAAMSGAVLKGELDYSPSGAAAPEGEGRIPSITGGEGGIGGWSVSDLAYFFETGFTPDFDTVGGSMVEVQENLAMLEAGDREAIAAYLKVVPEHASAQ